MNDHGEKIYKNYINHAIAFLNHKEVDGGPANIPFLRLIEEIADVPENKAVEFRRAVIRRWARSVMCNITNDLVSWRTNPLISGAISKFLESGKDGQEVYERYIDNVVAYLKKVRINGLPPDEVFMRAVEEASDISIQMADDFRRSWAISAFLRSETTVWWSDDLVMKDVIERYLVSIRINNIYCPREGGSHRLVNRNGKDADQKEQSDAKTIIEN